jgi:hypothetical protein
VNDTEYAPLCLLLSLVLLGVALVLRYADALDGPVVTVTTKPAAYVGVVEREIAQGREDAARARGYVK